MHLTTPQEVLAYTDSCREKFRRGLPEDYIACYQEFRTRLIDNDELDVVLPLCVKENMPINRKALLIQRVKKFFHNLFRST